MNNFRAGFLSIVGLPNVGKSTLTNNLSGYKISIVSPRPQTTRDHIKAIINGKDYQLIIIDTPGFLNPKNILEKSMAKVINKAIKEDADIICVLFEPDFKKNIEKKSFFEKLKSFNAPSLPVINKIDLYKENDIKKTEEFIKEIFPDKQIFKISAKTGYGIEKLKEEIIKSLPISEPYYYDDSLSDRWERFFVAEAIRENIFNMYSDEIPYSCSVQIDIFKENKGIPDEIYAVIYVSKKSHKPILIGKNGKSIKELREKSQKQIENFLNRKVKLELFVKVKENWENDIDFVKRNYEIK